MLFRATFSKDCLYISTAGTVMICCSVVVIVKSSVKLRRDKK